MSILQGLLNTGLSTILDLLPIVVILFGFQFLYLKRQIPNLKKVLLGFVYVLFGLAFFLDGLELALFPLGKTMAAQLTNPALLGIVYPGDVHWTDYYWVYIFAFAIGFATAIAEPALMAVAIKANEVSGGTIGIWGLRTAVALGVAIGLVLGSWRIITGYPLHWFIIGGYVIVVVQTMFAPRSIIALAYDSGGVSTSTVTVPMVAALGLGLAHNIPDRSPLIDGFGLIAFTCLFPIITVMAHAQIARWRARRATSPSLEN